MQAHIDKINEMATVMRKAIEVDEGRLCEDEERIKQLEVRLLSLHSDGGLCLYCKQDVSAHSHKPWRSSVNKGLLGKGSRRTHLPQS